MKNAILLLAAAVTAAAQQEPAAQPLPGDIFGAVSSASTVIINGKETPVQGVPSVPVASGDELTVTGTARARFKDTNRVEFDKLSNATVRRHKDGHTYVYLSKGGVRFLPVVDKLYICAVGHLFMPVPMAEGFVVITDKAVKILAHDNMHSVDVQGQRGCGKEGPLWYWGKAKPVSIIVGGAAATAAATAVTLKEEPLTADPEPVSRSR